MHTTRFLSLATLLALGMFLGCGDKDDTGTAGDGGATGDGGTTDGGTTDGGMTDGGMTDGGTTDGGMTDGGTTDGGTTDGGTTDGGSTEDAHESIAVYEGPSTCTACHEDAMHEIMGSTHYRFTAELPDNYMYDEDGEPVDHTYTGKFWKVCGFPTALAQSNWMGKLKDDPKTAYVDTPGGCGKCHVGIGIKPNEGNGGMTPSDDELAYNMDCLVCHAEDYSRKFYIATTDGEADLNGDGAPIVFAVPRVDGVFDFSDQTEAARTVTNTSAATCNRCHAKGGGGGVDIDGTMYSFKRASPFSADTDVHAAAGMNCTDCHGGEGHRMSRAVNSDLSAYDTIDDTMGCENCHDAEPHEAGTTNDHMDWIACTTCHATSKGGVTYKDFSDVYCPDGADCSSTGLDTYVVDMEKFPEDFALDYAWFNGTVERPIHPLGDSYDGKIYPFKIGTFNVPMDASGQTIPIKWGKVFVAGDMDAAISTGRSKYEALLAGFAGDPDEYGLLPVPGEFDHFGEVQDHFSISHGITVDSALDCSDCHSSSDSVLDWESLGLENPLPM